jgi:probable HAF family extracellular repeat protein
VNDADQVVGVFTSGPRRQTVSHAFLWQNGGFIELGTLGGSSDSASAINNSSQVVGSSLTTNGQSHAFLWQNGTIRDLGILPGGFSSDATAINDAGQIVGSSTTANFGPAHAVLFQNGVITDLGVPPNFTSSVATAINIHGVVVGVASVGSYGRNNHAFIAQNGSITDLNRLIPGNSGPWVLQTATGINDNGEIVGTGTNNGLGRAFLLTPTNETTVPASPIDLVATSGNAVVALTWDGSVGATSYNVKRANSSSGPFATVATVAGSNFTDHSATNCSTYSYVVSAVNSAGESPNSSSVTGAPQSVPPAPSRLIAKPDTNPNLFLGSAIDLAWQNNAGSCSESVIVERSTDGVNFQTLATYGNVQNTATDGFLNSGTRYFYRVRAQSNGGTSGPSNVASAVAR